MGKREKGAEQAKAWVEKARAVTRRRYGGAAEQLVREIMRDLQKKADYINQYNHELRERYARTE